MFYPLPPNESERLAALHKLEILDTPSSPAIDRICRIAQQLFDVPMVHVTLADAHRYYFKAKHGAAPQLKCRETMPSAITQFCTMKCSWCRMR
jgi:hypothetical protein